jgi:hypothetical protein
VKVRDGNWMDARWFSISEEAGDRICFYILETRRRDSREQGFWR